MDEFLKRAREYVYPKMKEFEDELVKYRETCGEGVDDVFWKEVMNRRLFHDFEEKENDTTMGFKVYSDKLSHLENKFINGVSFFLKNRMEVYGFSMDDGLYEHAALDPDGSVRVISFCISHFPDRKSIEPKIKYIEK